MALIAGNDNVNQLWRELEIVGTLNGGQLPHELDLTNKLDAIVIILGEVLDELDGDRSLGSTAVTLDDDAVAALADIAYELVEPCYFSPYFWEIELSDGLRIRHVATELVAVQGARDVRKGHLLDLNHLDGLFNSALLLLLLLLE